jgi:hypothetical protein
MAPSPSQVRVHSILILTFIYIKIITILSTKTHSLHHPRSHMPLPSFQRPIFPGLHKISIQTTYYFHQSQTPSSIPRPRALSHCRSFTPTRPYGTPVKVSRTKFTTSVFYTCPHLHCIPQRLALATLSMVSNTLQPCPRGLQCQYQHRSRPS